MQLPNELISEFVKATKDDSKANEDSVLYGTATVEAGGNVYVTIDGSTELTPVVRAATVNDGERVMVTIKDHTATIVGNMSSPAARSGDVEDLSTKVGEFNLVVADKVSTSELAAQVARINDLVADNVTIKGDLVANKASIESLEAQDVVITGTLDAQKASIKELSTKKIDAETVKATYATIENLDAVNANIDKLEAEDVKINGTLDAQKAVIDTLDTTYATIEKLQAEYATITSLENKYANIDFSNIGKAAMEYFYAQSGLIDNVTVGDQTITGELVGVTIKGDLIEGNTIKADKLVVKGSDGIYYKLNFENGTFKDGEAVPTDSLHGSIITAKSITADRVSVTDLVAFGATIGGFHITNNSIYSGVKETVGNTTRGIYIDNDGQIALGDSANYLKFYKDANDKYKLDISAASLTFGDNGTSIEDFQKDTIVSTVEEFVKSTSPTTLSNTNWSTTQPTWENGTYIWRRTKVTYGDGRDDYTPSRNGVCITGNTGAQGPQGVQGETGPQGGKGDQGEQGLKGDDGQMLYATCSTESGIAAKVATLSNGTLTLQSGATVAVKFTYANGVASPTLNVGSTGSKPIKLNGAALSTICDYWSAGASVTFVYDGSSWNITSVSDASKTASNFMYVDSTSGLQIGDRRTGSWVGYHTQILNDSFNVLDESNNQLAHYGAGEILLGKEGGFRTQVVPQAFNVLDSNDGTVLSISYTGNTTSPYSTIKGLRTQLIGDRYAKLGSFLVEADSGTYYANDAAIYTSAFGNPEIDLRVSRYESDSEGNSVGSVSGDSTIGVSPAQITLLNNVLILLESPSVRIEGNGNVTGELSAGSASVTGKVSAGSAGVTGALSAGSATVSGELSAASASVSGKLTVSGELSGADATFSKIELHRSTPYIDFHHGNSTADFTQRIITSNGGLLLYGTTSNYVAIMSDRFRSNGNDVHYLGDASNKWKDIYSVKSSINTSDRNQKKNIEPISDKYVAMFDKLQPVSYEFKSPTSDRTHIGFISQDVKASMDEVGLTDLDFAGYCRDVKMETVKVEDSETGETNEVEREVLDENGDPVYLYSLRYSEFIALNTKMIQLNKQKIAEQEREIETLRGEVSDLKVMVEKLLANQ